MKHWNRRALGGAVLVTAVGVGTGLFAAGGRGRDAAPKETTITGKIVDLQSYMTGKFATDDHVRATQAAIRAGTPAAVETEDGLVLIGQGQRGPMRSLMPMAMKEAEVKGTVYEKHGLRYIDMTSITRASKGDEETEEGEHENEQPGYDPDGPPDE